MSVTTGNLGIVRLTGADLAALRVSCFLRDGFRCQECWRRVHPLAPEWAPSRAHMAHVEGRGAGGSDELSNVRTLCGDCHMVGEHNPKSVPAKESL